jgi:hypothetical protein
MKLEFLHVAAKTALDCGVSSRNPIHVLAYIEMVAPPDRLSAAQAALTAMLRELEAKELGYHCAACQLYEDMEFKPNKGETLSIWV